MFLKWKLIIPIFYIIEEINFIVKPVHYLDTNSIIGTGKFGENSMREHNGEIKQKVRKKNT